MKTAEEIYNIAFIGATLPEPHKTRWLELFRSIQKDAASAPSVPRTMTPDAIEEAQMLAQEYILCEDDKITNDANRFKLRLIRAIIEEVRKDD